MLRAERNDGDGAHNVIVIGTGREIKSLYNRLTKKSGFYPYYTDEPRICMDKMYGLALRRDEDHDYYDFSVLSADTACRALAY